MYFGQIKLPLGIKLSSSMPSEGTVLLVFPLDFARIDTGGLREKAIGLLRGANSFGIRWQVAYQFKGELRISSNIEELLNLEAPSFVKTRHTVAFQHLGFWKDLTIFCLKNSHSSYWIRLGVPTPYLYNFISNLRGNIFLDIPTYPFRSERKGGMKVISVLTNPILNKIVNKCNYIVSPTSSEDQILGKPTISVGNGVDLDGIQLYNPTTFKESGPFVLAGFGQWSDWHGVDRLINGIAEAKRQSDFKIVLSGEGPALHSWKKLAKKYDVALRILPPLYSIQRDALIEQAHAGIGTLATHRRDLIVDSSLKHRMYLAYGLPFLVTDRDSISGDSDGIYQVIDSDVPIDMDALLVWLASVNQVRAKVADDLRNIAAEYSWAISYRNLYTKLRSLSKSV